MTRSFRVSCLWVILAVTSCFIFLLNVVLHETYLQGIGLTSSSTSSIVDAHPDREWNHMNKIKFIDQVFSNRDRNDLNQRIQGKPDSLIMNGNGIFQHRVAGLSCERYGGPPDVAANKMVYWEDIPTDSEYVSPFYDGTTKYLTFEPDGGGWNNIRMAMETIVAMAHATGRTLVLPPEKRMYLIGKGDNKQKFKFTFNDFFHLDSIHDEHAGFNMITMQDFLTTVAMNGELVNHKSGLVQYPPENRTKWDGEDLSPLWQYLRETSFMKNWRPMECVAVFPSRPNTTERWEEILDSALQQASNITKDTRSVPVAVDGNVVDRLRESLGGRKKICMYDQDMQSARVIHFMCSHKDKSRLLTHFYTFLFFENWKQDLFIKRFVRDHLRYNDEIMCAAARVIASIQVRAKNRDPIRNPAGHYDSFHIRRGDFQYKSTRIDSSQILENSKELLVPGSTIFIATDERDKTFFTPIIKNYDVCFLEDFKHLLEGINTNYYGMIDQIVASKGRTFLGTFYSTLSGYAVRMRGYTKARKIINESWDGGLNDTFYFVPIARKMEMSNFTAVRKLYFSREFPVSWRSINKSLEI